MKILSIAEKNRVEIESIFNHGGTLALKKKWRFDMAKYQKTIIGKELPEWAKDKIVWAERRKDSYGPYYALFTYQD